MITLIAESKTMEEREMAVAPEQYEENTPSGEGVADKVMRKVAKMSVAEIASAMKSSGTLSSKVARMAYEFPNKALGLRAIEGFTGVVFKGLDYPTLPKEAKARVDANVGIISSLYGWVRPGDIIKPYRFDFTTKLAPGERTFSEYWRKDVTLQLVRRLKETGETVILNLLPADAAKCVDWKLVKRFAKVYKVDFKELRDGGDWRTPHAGKLKALRGGLLREIVASNITTPNELLTLATDSLVPLGTPDYPDHIAFCV